MNEPTVRRGVSIPVDEAAVEAALQVIRLMPGGIEQVSMAVLSCFRLMMADRDFEAIVFDVEDAKR